MILNRKKLHLLLTVIMFLLVMGNVTAVGKSAISMWVYEPEQSRTQMNGLLAAFEKEAGYHVNVTYIPKGDFNTKINTAVAAGQAPDVSYLDQPLVPRFAVDRVILNLDSYAKGSAGIDQSQYYQGALNTNIIGGHLYGLPLGQSCVALYYNRDLVKTPPDTWDEWIATAKKVYKKGRVAAFEVPSGGGWGAWLFPAFVASAGGTMVNQTETRVTFDQPPAIAALQLWKDLRRYSEKEVTDSANAFENGFVATKVSGPWEIRGYRENFPKLHFGVALIPRRDARDQHATNIGGENLVIYQSSKNPTAAWKLLKYLTYRPENAIACAQITGNFPVLLQATQNSRYQTDEALKVFVKQMETAQSRPRITAWLKINDEVLGKAIDQAMSGEASPAEALKLAATKANLIIKRGK
jgi:multiple sugar transport system substrate-binding protein